MIVVAAHVLGCLAERVGLMHAAQGFPGAPQRPLHGVAAEPPAVDREEVEEVVGSAAVLEQEPAFHVGFRCLKFGIEEDLPFHLRVREADRHLGSVPTGAERLLRPVMVDDGQAAVLHETVQEMREKLHGERCFTDRLNALHGEHGIQSAEAEGVGNGGIHGEVARFVWHDVEVAKRVRFPVADRGRRHTGA